MLRETDTACRQLVDVRAGFPIVAVGAETVGAQGVDRNKKQIEVVPGRQGSDLRGSTQGS